MYIRLPFHILFGNSFSTECADTHTFKHTVYSVLYKNWAHKIKSLAVAVADTVTNDGQCLALKIDFDAI